MPNKKQLTFEERIERRDKRLGILDLVISSILIIFVIWVLYRIAKME